MTPQYRILRTGPNGRAPTVLHPTLRSAADEALRLAGHHPGDTFEILQIVGVARTSEPSIFWNDGFGPPPSDSDLPPGCDRWVYRPPGDFSGAPGAAYWEAVKGEDEGRDGSSFQFLDCDGNEVPLASEPGPPKLQLRVGGRYRNRLGEEVEIVRHDQKLRSWPFYDSNRQQYRRNGAWWQFDLPHELDLIEEIQPEPPYRNLEAGERIREGDEVWVSEDDGWMTYLPGAYGNKVPPYTKARRPIRPKQDPPAYHEWRYRGLGWRSEGPVVHAFSSADEPESTLRGRTATSGFRNTHYWEAVPVPGSEQ